MTIISRAALAASTAMLCALAACTAPNPPPAPPLPSAAKASLSTADAAFIQQVDEMDMKQIAIAGLAATHSNSDTLKAFAATVVADHTTSRAAVAKIASTSNLTVSGKIDTADQAHIDSFAHLYGSSFDRLFLREVVSGNGAAFDTAASSEAQSASSADVKTLAADTVKMEQSHVGRARDLMGDHTIRGHHHSFGRHS
ncbi:DUF4142 domain-containing protein [Gluconobacter wancherniae]|uniref:DUF4142 domain-containing protein n=1 Tax=Gluconobacter wancherniae NBRC 103581 TaxID=656744 RepID=A0A511AZH2_9PROT|nr:DUF4142 domain-containing protein [Gluconobacter wancherniae]MBF0853751.1 DUF4142 domain-containing protein [Gluconobacter wancherniae]GBD55500.1 hypothetical protein NBRC103581_00057 [Gluconobacter wancherniae NBRC 103581]GBR66668.1 hypothetical protein AA103581_2474 [Gluconobacter wancherniae NBRC 103581]GEK93599.1 hypothetical protein GWA01_13690 [Gluconobacter wancherniae NBRC 103581]